MAKLVLIQHSETRWNRDRRVQGQTPVALTDQGHRQAERLVATLAEPLLRKH